MKHDEDKKQRAGGFFRFEIPLYFTCIDIWTDPWNEKTLGRLSKKYNVKFEDTDLDGNAGVTFDLQSEPFNLSVIPILFDDLLTLYKKNRNDTIGLISHELLHAANIIIASRELGKVNEKGKDEVACYLMQDLMTKTLQGIERLLSARSKKKSEEIPEKKNKKNTKSNKKTKTKSKSKKEKKNEEE